MRFTDYEKFDGGNMERSSIEREKKEFKSLVPLLFGGLVLVALALALAGGMLGRVGLADNYVFLLSAAVVIVALLLSKNFTMLVFVALGAVAINMPDATLVSYGLDRDLLLALVCALILAPSLYNLVNK